MYKNVIISCLTLIFLVLILDNTVFGQSDRKNLDFSDLTFEISVPKERYFQWEPIPITFLVRNDTNAPISGHWAVDFSFPYIQTFINHNGQKRNVQHLFPVEGLRAFIPKDIQPLEAHEKTQVVDFSLDQMFPETGKYEIEFVLLDTQWKDKNNQKQIKSNVLEIYITIPNGQDLEALKFMKQNSGVSDYLDVKRMIADKKALKKAEEFLSKFSHTIYGSYVSLKVCEFYLFIGNSKGEVDPTTGDIIIAKASPLEAIKYLEGLSAKPDFALADRVLSYLTVAYSLAGDFEKAQNTLNLLQTKYPNSVYTHEAGRYIVRSKTER